MKKTIYISDLDGTLLSQNKEISNVTKNILNQLKRKVVIFLLPQLGHLLQ